MRVVKNYDLFSLLPYFILLDLRLPLPLAYRNLVVRSRSKIKLPRDSFHDSPKPTSAFRGL